MYSRFTVIVSSSILPLMMYILSTVAYRGSDWSGQRTPYPVGGYHHHQSWTNCCPWPPMQPPHKFTPESSHSPPPHKFTPESSHSPPPQKFTPESSHSPPPHKFVPEFSHSPPPQKLTPESSHSPPHKFTPGSSQSPPPSFSPLNKLGMSSPEVNTAAECKDGDKIYRLGDKWTPTGGCGRLSCTSAGKTTILGCPDPEPQVNCSTSKPDPRQPWPFCCPKLECP